MVFTHTRYGHYIILVGDIKVISGKYHPVYREAACGSAVRLCNISQPSKGSQPAEPPWIFVNHTTSSAADPRHQKEGVARPGPAILACSYDWVIFSNLRYGHSYGHKCQETAVHAATAPTPRP